MCDEIKNNNDELENYLSEVGEDEFANDEDDDIITLLSADGEEIDFVVISGIAHKGNFYLIMQPVELIPGMKDDEAFVFHNYTDDEGQDRYEIVLDDEIIDAVFATYNQILDNVEKSKKEDGEDEE